MSNKTSDNKSAVHSYIEKMMPELEKPAEGKILYPYLSVGFGQHYAGTVFCWDHYHMGIRFAKAGKPEYQKYLVDNLLEYQKADGCTPNCLSADGTMEYFPAFHAQPFLMRAANMYLEQTDDIEWAKSQFAKLELYLDYYEKNMRAPQGLFRWPVSWMSGFDNDVVTTFFQPDTVIPVDINAWLFLEYQAAAKLAHKIGESDVQKTFEQKAQNLKSAIDKTLWYEKAESYAAYDLCRQDHLFHFVDPNLVSEIGYYAYHSVSNLIPLFAGIPDADRAGRMIKRYLLDENQFMSKFGIRSLSRASEYYNNAVWGNPSRFGSHLRMTNSNWQGPVWIPINYFMYQGLLNYGFNEEANDLAERTNALLALSLQTIGSFSENYHAETGEPLYARKFASWNILADVM